MNTPFASAPPTIEDAEFEEVTPDTTQPTNQDDEAQAQVDVPAGPQGADLLATVYADIRMRMLDMAAPADLAAILGTTEATLAQWRKAGQGPKFFHIGKRVYYRMDDVAKFIDLYEPMFGGAKVEGQRGPGRKKGKGFEAPNGQPDSPGQPAIIPPGVPERVADGTVPAEDRVTGATAGILLTGIQPGEVISTSDPRLEQTLGDAIADGTITLGEGAAAAFQQYMQEETLPDIDAIEFDETDEEGEASTYETPA